MEGLVGVVATGLEPGGEVSDGSQALTEAQETFCQPAQVEPVVAAPASRFEVVVEVESANVHRYPIERRLVFVGGRSSGV